MAMNWTNSAILSFLRLYKGQPCIWDPKHACNKDRHSVNEAWADIQDSMPIPCTIPQLKKKKESLMSAYRCCKTKMRTSLNENGKSKYQPSWFAFKLMDSFLGAVYVPRIEEEVEVKPDISTEISIEHVEDDADGETTSDMVDVNVAEDSVTPPPQKRPKKGRYESYTTERTKDLDEIEVMTRMWMRKLKKIPQERRDYLIYKINNLIYSENLQQGTSLSEDYNNSTETVFVDECKSESD